MTKLPTCQNESIAGLGNRIKNIFSFIRRYNPSEMIMIWPDKGWVSKKFFELFVFNYPIKIHEYSDESQIDIPYLAPPVPTWRFWVDEEKDNISPNFSKMPLDRYECTFDLEYNRTPYNMKQVYLPYFRALKPVEEIKAIIDMVKLPPKTVGLQIRNEELWTELGRSTDIEKFISCMKKYPKDTFFYLSAMNENTSKKIKSVFGDRIIELPNKDYHSMFHAVADLYLLAQCEKAIFSCGSTFAELAWWLGECKANITIIGSYKNWVDVKKISKRKIISLKTECLKNGKKYKIITIFGIKIKLF